MSKIFLRFPQWISPRILLPVANLGEIPGEIAPRFLPPWICSLVRILGRFAVAFRQDFGRRILASRRESWRDSRQDPGEILAAGNFVSWRESCRDPSEIPPGKKNPDGQNLTRIPTGFLPRLRWDPAKIPVLTLQGIWQLEYYFHPPPRTWPVPGLRDWWQIVSWETGCLPFLKNNFAGNYCTTVFRVDTKACFSPPRQRLEIALLVLGMGFIALGWLFKG